MEREIVLSCMRSVRILRWAALVRIDDKWDLSIDNLALKRTTNAIAVVSDTLKAELLSTDTV